MVDLIELRRGKKELQRAGDFKAERFQKGIQHIRLVVIRQAAGAFGDFSFFA